MKEKNNSSIGFIELLQLLFIALKLTGCINWSWFFVLAPTEVCLIAVIIVVIFLNKRW